MGLFRQILSGQQQFNHPIYSQTADDGRVVADHDETKKIDDKTEAVFDFEVFDPLNDDLQNYFGYKITLREIENDTSESNDINILMKLILIRQTKLMILMEH